MCNYNHALRDARDFAKDLNRSVHYLGRMKPFGLPYNTAALALLTHMLAQQCDLIPHEIIVTTGDTHAYSNHMEQIQTQLARTPKKLPELVIKRKPASIYDYKFEDFEIVGYDADPSIKADVAI